MKEAIVKEHQEGQEMFTEARNVKCESSGKLQEEGQGPSPGLQRTRVSDATAQEEGQTIHGIRESPNSDLE